MPPVAEPGGGTRPTSGPVAGSGAARSEPGDQLFAALSDPTRRRVLRAVSERGPVTATALCAEVPVSRQAIARHLSLLQDAGLVRGDRAGRETRFTTRSEPLDDLAAWAADTGRRWEQRLARLRESLRHEVDHRAREEADGS